MSKKTKSLLTNSLSITLSSFVIALFASSVHQGFSAPAMKFSILAALFAGIAYAMGYNHGYDNCKEK